MGRGKSAALRLIHDRKKRFQTFEKRKKGLEKKAYELSTLCDVNICMIMFGPDGPDGPDDVAGGTKDPTVWPEDRSVTSRMISMYKNQRKGERHCRRNSSIASFYQDRISVVEKEVSKLKKQNIKEKYPIWHESYDMLSNEQLLEFGNELDSVLHVLKSRIETLETEQVFQAISSCGSRGKELETYHPCQGLNSFNYFGNELEQVYGSRGKELESYHHPMQSLTPFCFGNEGAFAVDNSQTMALMGESSSSYNNYTTTNNDGDHAIVPANFDNMITNTNYYCSSSGENLMQFNNSVIMNQPRSQYMWYATPEGQMQVFMPSPLSSVDASQMLHGGIDDQWVGNYNFQL